MTGEVTDEIENDLTADDKAAIQNAKARRPSLNFFEMDMQKGDVLVWKDDKGKEGSKGLGIIWKKNRGRVADMHLLVESTKHEEEAQMLNFLNWCKFYTKNERRIKK